MKTFLQLLLFVLSSASCRGDPASIRNCFLPLWYQEETSQTCHLQLQGLRSPLIRINHNCSVTMESNIVAATNGRVNVCFTVDLQKAHPGNAFTLQVFGLDGRGQMENLEQEWVCHASLVPFRVQVTTRGDSFALTNLTSEPFQVEQSEGVVFEKITPALIYGTFAEGASVQLRSHGKIRLKKEHHDQ